MKTTRQLPLFHLGSPGSKWLNVPDSTHLAMSTEFLLLLLETFVHSYQGTKLVKNTEAQQAKERQTVSKDDIGRK